MNPGFSVMLTRLTSWRTRLLVQVGNIESSLLHALSLLESVERRKVVVYINAMTNGPDERSPLLQNGHAEGQQDEPEVRILAT